VEEVRDDEGVALLPTNGLEEKIVGQQANSLITSTNLGYQMYALAHLIYLNIHFAYTTLL